MQNVVATASIIAICNAIKR